MDNNPLVSVVIPTWDQKWLLLCCLQSVHVQTYPNIEAIVIDNASEDDTFASVRELFPEVKIIRNEKNRLFAAAQNQGILAARGEFILSLNNDVILDKHCIQALVAAITCNECYGMCCGKTCSSGGNNIDSTGLSLARAMKPLDRDYGKPLSRSCQTPGEVWGASGAVALYRRRMLDEICIGGMFFDESLGLFYEDLDLAFRARQAGWKAYFTPQAVSFHRRGSSTMRMWCDPHGRSRCVILPRLTNDAVVCYAGNWHRFIRKHASFGLLLRNLPWIMLYGAALWGYLLCVRPRLIPRIIRAIYR